MGDDERPEAPQLEAPTLGRMFGRRKARTDEGAQAQAAAGTPDPDAAPAIVADPAPPAERAPIEELAPVEDTTVLDRPVAPAPVADLRPLNEARDRRAAAQPKAARAPRATLTVSGRVAAAVTGLLIGLLVVVLTAGSLALCESVRGVSSCGGGPGFALLVAVTLAMIVLGGVMLRLARVPDPGSTSFLAVGLLCVLSLLFLVDVLDEWWMVLVIPALSTATFLLSHWVTTAVVEAD